MAGSPVSVTTQGPLFEGVAQVAVFHSAEAVVKELTEAGMERLRSAFPTGVPVKSGNLRRHIHAATYGARAQIDSGGVVYASWIEGTSSRNETTRFKGYATYRRTRDWLEARAQDVSAKHAKSLARELGG